MYIDPGTGSVLFQVLIASALGAGVLIKIFWKKIVSLFSKKPVEVSGTQDEAIDSDVDGVTK
jgi:hypothetical protein